MARSHPSWNPEGRGCKGGAGPTAGKTARRFRFYYPDGRAGSKRVFNLRGAAPFVALCYKLRYDDTEKRGGARVLLDEPRLVWACTSIYRQGELPDWAERSLESGFYVVVPAEEVE